MTGSKNIEEALHILPVASSKMEEAIQLWDDMYKGEASWLHEPTVASPEKVVSLGLAAFIAGEKARTATIEMQSLITNPKNMETSIDAHVTEDFEPKDRAEYLNKQYQLHLLPHIRKQLEYGIAKGGLVIKPYIYDEDQIRFTFCQADEFYPISFDPTGQMTEAAFTERLVVSKVRYTRLEYHKLDLAKKQVTVINKAFKAYLDDQSTNGDDLGTEIPLKTVPAWAKVQEETVINDVDRLLFAYFKMPEANTIDPKSPLGVSGFSRAVPLIKEADLQFSRTMWEYEGGEMAVDVDLDALKTREAFINGKMERVEVPNVHQARLFRKVDLGDSDTYQVFAPNLRDASYLNGLNSILQRIEDVTGISRGTLSDITRSEAKTATEMLILKQRSYSTNRDIQMALQEALKDTVYIMDVYCTLYNLAPEGEYSVSYEWDDSLINSPEEELQRRLTLQKAGLESKLNIRMWYFGETEEQATKELERIEEEAVKTAETQALATGLVQQNNSNAPQNDKNKDNKPPQNGVPPQNMPPKKLTDKKQEEKKEDKNAQKNNK